MEWCLSAAPRLQQTPRWEDLKPVNRVESVVQNAIHRAKSTDQPFLTPRSNSGPYRLSVPERSLEKFGPPKRAQRHSQSTIVQNSSVLSAPVWWDNTFNRSLLSRTGRPSLVFFCNHLRPGAGRVARRDCWKVQSDSTSSFSKRPCPPTVTNAAS